MHTINQKNIFSFLLIIIFVASLNAAEKMNVIIIDRQDNNSQYTYVLPGFSSTTSNAIVTASAYGNSGSAIGTSTSTTTNVPAMSVSYQVRGATLTLKLPDKRIVVVNCEKKINWGHVDRYRSCRMPLVDEIEAEFKGDNAKLKWPVSLDGKKKKTETYKILAVFNKSETSNN